MRLPLPGCSFSFGREVSPRLRGAFFLPAIAHLPERPAGAPPPEEGALTLALQRISALPALPRYLLASSLFAIALAARFAMVGMLAPQGFPFLTFFPAVMLAAWLTGLGPGLMVSALSVAAARYWFVGPDRSLGPLAAEDGIALAFFAAILVVDCVVLHVMNTALARVRRTERLLRDNEHSLRSREATLREADRQKDVLLATLAHELRNPLAPIRSAARALLLGRHADPAVLKMGAVIERQSAQLSRLVDDLLDVSRIRFGTLGLQRRPVDLRRIVDIALETCRPMIADPGRSFSVSLPQAPLMVDADEMRLAQAVSNLLDNAFKFTARDGRVALEVHDRQDGWAALTVRDDGAGLPEGMLDRVFEPFAQERRSGMGGNTGLGMGLALSRTMVEMHGGRISARSDGVGRGAAFEILLPAQVPDDPPAGREPAATQGHRGRLLVVDDNLDTVESMDAVLTAQGHTVFTALDGRSALATVRAHRPSVVLLDIGLPDMTGYEVARRIGGLPDLRDRPLLIALTGWGQEGDRDRAFEAGFDHHMTKPAEVDALAALVQRHLAAIGSREAAGDPLP